MNAPKNRSYRSLFWITAISVICFSAPAFAKQNLYVKPMIIEINPYPGMTVETSLEIFNASNQTRFVKFDLHELTQGRNAFWQILGEAGLTAKDVNVLSCYDWVSLSDPNVIVGPARRTKIKVRLKVPPTAKGFYLAGLTATLSPTQAPGGVGIVVRFLVPILVDIRARAQRQKLTLTDVGMKFRPESSRMPASTLVTMTIANEGKTYSSVEGSVMVKKRVGENWRRITEVEFDKRKVIPSVEVQLETDIERRLPSGEYKLFGQFNIEGRRAKPLEKIIEFEGDPTISDTATDAAIELQPQQITIETMPGATRSTVIQVSNVSESGVVEVAASLEVPEMLKGVALGALQGEELTCPQWLTVRPTKFNLRSGARQNIRIVAKMPNSELEHANYYASLNLRSRYNNGQSAGNSSALFCVHNKNLESQPKGQVMKLTLGEEKPSRYIVTALFGNVGNIHFSPKCRVVIINEEGKRKANLTLKGDLTSMFPLEVRGFSEVVDFSGFEPGRYYVEAIMDYGTGEVASARISIRVSVENREKIVEIVKPE